jgi:hypothetical protein
LASACLVCSWVSIPIPQQTLRQPANQVINFSFLLPGLIGVSQLTFGAYYISKLPVFKLGSPVWIGFLASFIFQNWLQLQ